MNAIAFEHAAEKDLEEIIQISIRSFHSDITAGADMLKGPPGYDSMEFHREMLAESTAFYKIFLNRKTVGAFWFIEKENHTACLYRIFVDPDYHRHGIGLKAFNFLCETYPGIKIWQLKTPKWNKRTPAFYKKAGFEISNQTDRFYFFEKAIE